MWIIVQFLVTNSKLIVLVTYDAKSSLIPNASGTIVHLAQLLFSRILLHLVLSDSLSNKVIHVTGNLKSLSKSERCISHRKICSKEKGHNPKSNFHYFPLYGESDLRIPNVHQMDQRKDLRFSNFFPPPHTT